MKSINNHTNTQQQKIEWNLSGLSEKCNYSEKKKSACCNGHRPFDPKSNAQTRVAGSNPVTPKEGYANESLGTSSPNFRLEDLNSQPSNQKSHTQNSSTTLPKEDRDNGGLGNSIQIYSQGHKRYKRLFKIQEEVLNKDIHKTVRYCKRIQSFHSKEIIASEGKKNGSIKGVFSCQSSHCPVCFGYIADENRKRLKKVIEYSKQKNMRIVMMTLTFSHQYHDDFQKVCDALSRAKTYLMRQRKFQSLDVQWYLSRLEFTHSHRNGFHPHYHIALGVNDWENTTEEILKLEWMRVCQKFGLKCSFDRGLDTIVDENFNEVENYIMKNNKDLSYEIASDGTKSPKNRSVSMEYLMDILAGIETDERYTKEDSRRILEIYYAGIKGKSIFSASNKFKDIEEELIQREKDKEEEEEQDDQTTPDAPCLKIGRWILHYLARSNQLHYLYDFIGHNNLTRLYDDLISVVPEGMIGGVVWVDVSDVDSTAPIIEGVELRLAA